MDKLRLPIREATQEWTPKLDLLKRLYGGRNARRAPLRRGRGAKQSDAAFVCQMPTQIVGVAGAQAQLVRVNDGQRVEGKVFEREAHRVERKVVQPSPAHRTRCRMHDRAILLKRKTAIEKLRIVPAVVEKDDGRRVVIVQVAYQINDAFLALMHKTRIDITHGLRRKRRL